jgi:hypothetical protein
MELFEDFVTSRMEAGYPALEEGKPYYFLLAGSSYRYIVCAIRRSLFFDSQSPTALLTKLPVLLILIQEHNTQNRYNL